jgi:prepilin-type N-terminal cleavage/methylation domain-containing protein
MLNLKQSKNSHRASKKGGFTLVELLVTIVIFVALTGVVLVNQGKFNSAELLNNFTYDMALTIKQAQSYAVNVRENVSGAFNSTGQAYGVYFNTNTTAGAEGSKTNFVLFNDTTNQAGYNSGNGLGAPDKIYNGSLTSCPTDDLECIQKYSIQNGLYINHMCVGTDENDCNNNGGTDKLSILFIRPKLDAVIYNGNNIAHGPYVYAKITLAAPDGSMSNVIITSVGQIYVKRSN